MSKKGTNPQRRQPQCRFLLHKLLVLERGPKWFRVLDYEFKRMGMSRERKVDLFMHASISAITFSLYCHLASLFIYLLFIYFLSGCFLSTSCHSSPFPLLIHSYFYPFYIFSNLWDCSLLSLRLYQPLLASFQDCLLACSLLGHYLCSEGAYHTIPHFQKKVFVFLFLSHSLPCLPLVNKD